MEDPDLGAVLAVSASFEEIRRRVERGEAVVIFGGAHAGAVVHAFSDGTLGWVDPLSPETILLGEEGEFRKRFNPDSYGQFFITPVKILVKERKS